MRGWWTAPPLDPDRDEARRLLEEELGRPGYDLQESWLRRAIGWILDRLPSLDLDASLPPWAAWAGLAVLLVAAAAVAAFATRDRWRKQALKNRPQTGAVLEGPGLTAPEHRARAREALAAGDPDRAVVEGYRALAVSAIERTLLDDRPGRTAHEVALSLAPIFPGEGSPLARAADLFDAVRYGDQHVDRSAATEVLELEQRLLSARPALAVSAP